MTTVEQSNFKRIIVAESKEDLADLEFPCVLLVGDASDKTKKEGLAIVFGDFYLMLRRVFNSDRAVRMPTIVLLLL